MTTYIIELISGTKLEVKWFDEDEQGTLEDALKSITISSTFGEEFQDWDGIKFLRSQVAAYYPKDREI